jgi:hypothetical protein
LLIAIDDPLGLNANPYPKLVGRVAGLAYLVPKPEADQGYAVTNGVPLVDTAIADPFGLNATPLP